MRVWEGLGRATVTGSAPVAKASTKRCRGGKRVFYVLRAAERKPFASGHRFLERLFAIPQLHLTDAGNCPCDDVCYEFTFVQLRG